jgi:hypothetical protein
MRLVLFTVVFFLLVCRNIDAHSLYSRSTRGAGAVYTMSNAPTMNQILIHRLSIKGKLTMVGAVNTNGTGVSTTKTDPLVSQGPLIVYSNYLFAVNPGSNSLSMFMINSSDATQLTLLSVQPTNGWFPISVTVNDMYACVLTGGNITGIRCFTYNSSGLYVVPSFDRNLTSFISQTVPPKGPPQSMSEILFSADNLSLIIAVKGLNEAARGYLLFYLLSDHQTKLSSSPIQVTPNSAIFPFSMTLVERNGLLITDPGAEGVLTLKYSSTNGKITNSLFTPIDPSLAGALCWSTYSPTIGNYYVIGVSPAAIVELNLNLSSISNPVRIIRYYSLPKNTGALEATVVTLVGKDYLYVIGTTAHVISGYQLNEVGNAIPNTISVVQEGDTSRIPKLSGIAAFVQN